MPLQLPRRVPHETMAHAPAVQPTVPFETPEQTLLQAPQFVTVSRARSQPFMTEPSQSPQPGEHIETHVPLGHVAVELGRAGHAAPQLPQSVVVRTLRSQPSLTVVLQSATPALQLVIRQAPATHAPVAAGGAHAASHAPQWSSSLVRSAQSVPHAVRPIAQVFWHATPAPEGPQTGVVPPHAAPHAPQSVEIVSGVSQPSLIPPPQSPYPASQLGTHVPVAQLAVAWSKGPHAVPQVPQSASVSSGVSHPSATIPLQSPHPASQPSATHAPISHSSPARGTSHTSPHARQSVSDPRGTSQPSFATPLQSPRPALHATISQVPVAQDSVASGRLQATPQAPQLVGLVRSVSQPF